MKQINASTEKKRSARGQGDVSETQDYVERGMAATTGLRDQIRYSKL